VGKEDFTPKYDFSLKKEEKIALDTNIKVEAKEQPKQNNLNK
jgi:hypothetical protein